MTVSLECEELEPMLRGATWGGLPTGWAVLTAQRPLEVARRAVGRWRARHSVDHRVLEPDEHLSVTLIKLHQRMENKEGLARPSECEHTDPTAWMYTVFSRAASTAYRDEGGMKKQREDSLDQLRESGDRDEPVDDVDPLIKIEKQKYFARREAFQQAILAARTPAPRKLAYVCLEALDYLTVELVTEACATTHQAGAGLTRSPDDTWVLLQEFESLHAHKPDDSHARRRLAWILRGPPGMSLERWATNRPADLRRARDTVRQWARRARVAVEAQQ